MNYYEILGVSDKATSDEIKRAYRRLASQHHPDKGGDKNKFQEIQAAYDTLSDNNRRQQYDMQRNGFGGPGVQFHWHGPDMSSDLGDIFARFGFGGGDPFFHGFRQQQRRNKDLRIELSISLEESLEEQKKTISVQTTNGERTTVEVTIPRGVTSGTQIKYTGLGDNLFNTIPRGDLYVQIYLQPNPLFSINGIDLHTTISINCLEAIVGKDVTVNGLSGKIYELNIPPGTQPKTKFRLPGQGLYQMNSSIRGNLYVEVEVVVPKDLNKDQLDLIQNLISNQ